MSHSNYYNQNYISYLQDSFQNYENSGWTNKSPSCANSASFDPFHQIHLVNSQPNHPYPTPRTELLGINCELHAPLLNQFCNPLKNSHFQQEVPTRDHIHMQSHQMQGMSFQNGNQLKRPYNAYDAFDYENHTSEKRSRCDLENLNHQTNKHIYTTNGSDHPPQLFSNMSQTALPNQSNSLYHREVNNIPIESEYFQSVNASNMHTQIQQQTAMPILQENYNPSNQHKKIDVQKINVSVKDQNQLNELQKYSCVTYKPGSFYINHRVYDELRKEDKKEFDALCERVLNLTAENIKEIKHNRLKYQKRNCKKKNVSKWESAKSKNQKRRSYRGAVTKERGQIN